MLSRLVRVLVFVCLVFGGNFALANRMENSRGSRGIAAACLLALLVSGLSINIYTIERIFISQLSNDAGCLDTHTHTHAAAAAPSLLQTDSRDLVLATPHLVLGLQLGVARRLSAPWATIPRRTHCPPTSTRLHHSTPIQIGAALQLTHAWATGQAQGELSNEGQRRLGAEHRLNLFALAAAGRGGAARAGQEFAERVGEAGARLS